MVSGTCEREGVPVADATKACVGEKAAEEGYRPIGGGWRIRRTGADRDPTIVRPSWPGRTSVAHWRGGQGREARAVIGSRCRSSRGRQERSGSARRARGRCSDGTVRWRQARQPDGPLRHGRERPRAHRHRAGTMRPGGGGPACRSGGPGLRPGCARSPRHGALIRGRPVVSPSSVRSGRPMSEPAAVRRVLGALRSNASPGDRASDADPSAAPRRLDPDSRAASAKRLPVRRRSSGRGPRRAGLRLGAARRPRTLEPARKTRRPAARRPAADRRARGQCGRGVALGWRQARAGPRRPARAREARPRPPAGRRPRGGTRPQGDHRGAGAGRVRREPDGDVVAPRVRREDREALHAAPLAHRVSLQHDRRVDGVAAREGGRARAPALRRLPQGGRR